MENMFVGGGEVVIGEVGHVRDVFACNLDQNGVKRSSA